MVIKKAIVVGNGNIALRHRKNLKLLIPDIKIIAVPTRDIALNQKIDFADIIKIDLQKAIKEDVDIAIVASPATFHLPHSRQLMIKKIPVLIEKPLTSNTHDAEELIKLQLNTNTPACIGYCLRYLSSSLKIKELLDKRIVGNIYNVFINVGQFLPEWRTSTNYKITVSANKNLGGGALLELSHELDYIQWLFGLMKVHYAQLRGSSELKLEVEEIADVVLVSGKGIVCNLHMDFLQKKPTRNCYIIGEKGNLHWDLLNNSIQFHTKKTSEYLFNENKQENNKMYLDLLKDFLDLASGRKNTTINLQQALNSIILIDKIKSCAIQGTSQ